MVPVLNLKYNIFFKQSQNIYRMTKHFILAFYSKTSLPIYGRVILIYLCIYFIVQTFVLNIANVDKISSRIREIIFCFLSNPPKRIVLRNFHFCFSTNRNPIALKKLQTFDQSTSITSFACI